MVDSLRDDFDNKLKLQNKKFTDKNDKNQSILDKMKSDFEKKFAGINTQLGDQRNKIDHDLHLLKQNLDI